MKLFRQLSSFLLVASAFACQIQAVETETKATDQLQTNMYQEVKNIDQAQKTTYPEYKNIDQSFVYFKAINGAKYPYMVKCQPSLNQVDMILCGTEQDGAFWLATNPSDLENLSVVRHTMKFADSGIQIDKKCPGYRDTVMAILLEGYLKAIGLMPSGEYKGTVLVDEYCQGLPMKWVLSSINEFKALKTYLLKNFVAKNIVPAATKPLLLVEFVTATTLDTEDKAFLQTYFTLLDNNDQEAKTFFEQSQDKFDNIMEETKDAKVVAESLGEILMRKIETSSGDLEMKKIVAIVIGFVAGGICFKMFIDWVSGNIKDGVLNSLGLKKSIPDDQKPVTSGDISHNTDRLITALQAR